jgi:lipid A disaccharide synthetase
MQEELVKEMIQQGEREDIANHLARILKTKEKQQIMMKYLISIRKEQVSEVEVIQVAQRISEM